MKFQFVLFVSHWTSLISAVIIIYILFQSKAFLQIFPSYVTSLDQCITWIRWSTYCVIGRVCSKMRNRNRNTNMVVFGNKKKNNGHLWLHVSQNLSLKCDFNEHNSFKMYLRRFEKYSIPFGKKTRKNSYKLPSGHNALQTKALIDKPVTSYNDQLV